ncbi:MAG: hypothetical protein KDB74_04390 [Flavobacteriales bacterium]|nr:hypothetical protein [Flavobacteriales bacterium]
MKILIAICVFLVSYGSIKAQVSDTTIIDENISHSPTKSTLLSLAVPGLGQAYNKKYWKIPLVYAIIGTPLFFAIDQKNKFENFKSAYLKRVDDDPNTIDYQYQDVYTNENMQSLIDYHRKNRDLMFVLTGLAYVINVVDASVDAHLFYFDVNDDISGIIRPDVQYLTMQRSFVPSLTLSLKFGKKYQQY